MSEFIKVSTVEIDDGIASIYNYGGLFFILRTYHTNTKNERLIKIDAACPNGHFTLEANHFIPADKNSVIIACYSCDENIGRVRNVANELPMTLEISEKYI